MFVPFGTCFTFVLVCSLFNSRSCCPSIGGHHLHPEIGLTVLDLAAAMDPRAPSSTLCIRTLVEHSGRVFRLQFDEFQIVSSSHDDTILIWDFLNCTPPEKSSPQRSYTYVSNF